jgi:hypothetical protein
VSTLTVVVEEGFDDYVTCRCRVIVSVNQPICPGCKEAMWTVPVATTVMRQPTTSTPRATTQRVTTARSTWDF